MPVTEFVIHRSKWARGAGIHKLLDEHGQQCCVGIYLSACGVPDDALRDLGTANSVAYDTELPSEASWLLRSAAYASLVASSLYGENDGKARESEIARLFAEQGITVRFED